MSRAMNFLLNALKKNRLDFPCDILDYAPAREICRIAWSNGYTDFYSLMAYIRDNHEGYLERVLKEAIENFEPVSDDEFEGLLRYYISLRKSAIIEELRQYLNEYDFSNGVDRAYRKIIDYIGEYDRINSLSSRQVVDMGDAVDEVISYIIDRYNNPGIPGVTTGFSNLNQILGGWREGALVYIGGRPGMGKTSIAINSAIRCAKAGIPVYFVSREMRFNRILSRILSLLTGIPIAKLDTGVGVTSQDLELIKKKASEIKELPIYIDDNFTRNIYSLLESIRKRVDEDNVRVVYIDYIQLLVDRRGESLHEIGRVSRLLKLLAEELKITIVVLSQLNRSVESREDKRPMLSDLRQSGYMEEDGDAVLLAYRDDYYNRNSKHQGILEINVAKNREGESGIVLFHFKPEIGLIEEVSHGK